ncbi:MAG TPA: hypothetical protein VKG25_07745 [Bryobacteraceae bacterium]|nr:hypothetical protein [Bryobacteraceae bacterium]
MRLAVLLGLLVCALQANPRLIFSKYFKGSKPESVLITVELSGEASYREGTEDDNPLHFRLAETEAREMFQLAGKLDHFQHPLESGLKVANMGKKTLRFEDGDQAHEAIFNYSEDPNAKLLTDWFERISESEQEYIELDNTMHFDKLGVDHALALIQITYDQKRLVAPQQFLPLLDRVSKNESFLHIARARAASLAETFRGGAPQP